MYLRSGAYDPPTQTATIYTRKSSYLAVYKAFTLLYIMCEALQATVNDVELINSTEVIVY